MKILIINSGSSSLKYQCYEDENVISVGGIERIGDGDAIINYQSYDKDKIKEIVPIKNHEEGLIKIISLLIDSKIGVMENIQEIDAVGHRVVHGGELYSVSVLITDEVINNLEKLSDLAPLHNPANIMGIRACKDLLSVPQIAVFDTSFHQTLPPESYLYSLPQKYYQKYGLRRYGFHGISHQFIWESISGDLNNEQLKIISCHIGNGASVAAISGGNVVATSMGFTPLEGLTMGTRSGDIDPGALLFLMEKEGLTPKQMTHILNKESGVLGLSGYSGDLRDIESGHIADQSGEKLVMDIYVNQIVKYIGAYYVMLGGCDAIVFTAGVMEKSPYIRSLIVNKLECLGIKYDKQLNDVRSKKICFSADDSKVQLRLIPTNEEWMIARDVYGCLQEM